MRDRTTILISHRLDLARRADRVVVLEGGSIVEEGAPIVLSGQGGVFDRLFLASPPVREPAPVA